MAEPGSEKTAAELGATPEGPQPDREPKPQPESTSQPEPQSVPPRQPKPEPKSGYELLIDSIADLLQTASDWVRQEAGSIVREKVVLPIQKLGLTLASAAAAGCLLVIGLIFIAVALYLVLASAVGHPGALAIIGGTYVVAAAVFLVIKVRSMQR